MNYVMGFGDCAIIKFCLNDKGMFQNQMKNIKQQAENLHINLCRFTIPDLEMSLQGCKTSRYPYLLLSLKNCTRDCTANFNSLEIYVL